MLAILDKIRYTYKCTRKKLYKIWIHEFYSLKSIVNFFLVSVVKSYTDNFKGFKAQHISTHYYESCDRKLWPDLNFGSFRIITTIWTKKYPSAFKIHAPSYNIKVLVSTDTTIQLSIAKPHIKNILKDLLAGMKGFKSQIIFHETFPKKIENGEIKFP